MAFRDIRQFIEGLDKTGDLVRVKQEVDWDREAGAIARRNYEMLGPAVFFEKIKDYPEGYRIFSGGIANYRRIAIAMGLDPNTPVRDIFDEYERREEHLVKPIVVDDGPCKENIITGDDIDLYSLPAPMIHDGDGGRYIGSWHIIVSQDPDTGWTNWGMYRHMVHNQRSLAAFPLPHSHLAVVLRKKYLPAGKPMPVALVTGAEPLTTLAASATIRMGEDEVNYAGAIRQEAVELVKCETNDLMVPATAEIVIEGELEPDRCVPEGPFGEYSGYRSVGVNLRPLFRVTAITHRTSPILTMCAVGVPADENQTAWVLSQSLGIKRRLKARGLPVIDVFMTTEGTGFILAVSVETGGREVTEQIGAALTSRRAGISKILVVDRDTDVFSLSDVAHAFATKCHPGRGIIIINTDGKSNPAFPAYSSEERKGLLGATAVFDCTWPPEWPKDEVPVKSAFAHIYSRELQEHVLNNWKGYGFK